MRAALVRSVGNPLDLKLDDISKPAYIRNMGIYDPHGFTLDNLPGDFSVKDVACQTTLS